MSLAQKYETEQKAREAGICYSRLAHLLKHIGPMDEAAVCGQKAIHYLRQSEDKGELARALRVGRVPFAGVPEGDYLRESLNLAREVRDREQEAWTIYRFTRALTPPHALVADWDRLPEEERRGKLREWQEHERDGHTVEEALAIFESLGHPVGIATCLVSLGVERKPSDRALFERAIELYQQEGLEQDAKRTQMMADTFAPKS